VNVPVVLSSSVGEEQIDVIPNPSNVEVIDRTGIQAVRKALRRFLHHQRVGPGVAAYGTNIGLND
jgi:hypothetical protein